MATVFEAPRHPSERWNWMVPTPLKKVAAKNTVMREAVMLVGVTCVPSLKIITVPSLKLLPTMVTCTDELPATTDPGVTLVICGELPVKQTFAPQESNGRSVRTARDKKIMRVRSIGLTKHATIFSDLVRGLLWRQHHYRQGAGGKRPRLHHSPPHRADSWLK